MLEGLLANKATARASSEHILNLRDQLAHMETLIERDDARGFLKANAHFHHFIAALAEHDAATQLLEVLETKSRRFSFRSTFHQLSSLCSGTCTVNSRNIKKSRKRCT